MKQKLANFQIFWKLNNGSLMLDSVVNVLFSEPAVFPKNIFFMSVMLQLALLSWLLTLLVTIEYLYRQEHSRIPFQAIECYLADVRPKGTWKWNAHLWSVYVHVGLNCSSMSKVAKSNWKRLTFFFKVLPWKHHLKQITDCIS